MKIFKKRTIVILLAALIVLFAISLLVGRYYVSPTDLIMPHRPNHARALLVLLNIRLPRVIAAVVIGAALASAGASFQTLFRNPMASPATLGASSGAAFGALLGIFLEQSYGIVIAMAFLGGLFSIIVVLGLLDRLKIEPVLGLVLTGMVVSALFSGLNSLLKLLADPLKTLPEMTYWLFGSLANIGYRELVIVSIVIGIAWLLLYLLSYRINILATGIEEANTMGINARQVLYISVVLATLLTASSVAISGIIGWIGLIVPHICRSLVGHDMKYLIPTSSLVGAIFLLIIDMLSRTIYTSEIPVGILISLLGAPIFLIILYRRRSSL